MKKKMILPIALFITIALIISVGFTAWRLTAGGTLKGDVGLISEKAINTNKYLAYDSSNEIKCFNYYKNGFLNEDGSLSTTGDITVSYIIDFDECKNDFLSYNGVNALVALKYSDDVDISYDIFNASTSKVSISYKCFIGNNLTPFMQGTLPYDGLIVLAYSNNELQEESGTNNITIQYTFSVQSFDDFNTYLYPNLNSIHFAIETKVEPIK